MIAFFAASSGVAGNIDYLVCVDGRNAKVACPDIKMRTDQQTRAVAQPYRHGNVDALEKSFEHWRGGGSQFGDGTWELALFLPGLAEGFTTVTADTAKVAAWRKQKPDSATPLFAEAILWYVHAIRVRGRDPHNAPSKEAKVISAERLARSAHLLRELAPRMSDSPVWYETQIAVLVEQGSVTAARKVFDEAVRRFPRYHPLYFKMSKGYKAQAFEAFANRAAELTSQFEGRGLYARLYQLVDDASGMPFDPGRRRLPGWPQLRTGYEDLLQRYPSSIALANSFASVLCRTGDSAYYRRMRNKADEYLYVYSFTVVPVEACDRRHGWNAVE